MVSRWCRVLSQWCRSGVMVLFHGRFPVVSRWCCRMSSGVSVPVAVVSRAVVCLGGVPVLFPNSQVWGLLLTGFMFVLASIFGECRIRCPSLFSSWCPVSRRCPSGVSAV